MKKAKRYADGGPTTPGSYPFPQSLSGAGSTSPAQPSNTNVFVGGQGQGQSPLGGAPVPQPQPQAMKKGGCTKMAKGGSTVSERDRVAQEPMNTKYDPQAKIGTGIYLKKVEPDPRDKDIFTADKMGKDKKVPMDPEGAKAKGGAIKKMARGGGIEQRGKTRGRFV